MFFFDMDGVLTDSNGIWKKVDREFLARRGMKYTHAYYEGVAHVPLPQAAVFTKEFCKLPEPCEAIVAEWMELAADSYAHVPVKPGVRAYLKQCRAEGRRMAVVTSSVPEHCHMALEALGRIYGASQKGLPTIEFPKKQEHALRRIAVLQAENTDLNGKIKKNEEEIEAHSVRIAELMKAHEHGVLETATDKLLVDFVTKTTRRVDSGLLKKTHPDIYQDSLKVSLSRKVKVSIQSA